MDIVIIAGALFLVLGGLVVVGLVFVRRRAASQEQPKKAIAKPKKRSNKKEAKVSDGKKAKRPKQVTTLPTNNTKIAEATPAGATPSPSGEPVIRSKSLEELEAAPGEKIRILIVDDNEGTRENVSRLLYFEDDLDVVGQGMNGLEGIEMAVELQPHIVLMDINMPDMDGITATQEMGIKAPYSQVIIMSVQADRHYMKRAMAAGARDFQPKPFTSEELVGCIRRVYGLGKSVYQQIEATEQAKVVQQTAQVNDDGTLQTGDQRTPVIVVYSPKGGVGTSALASNLAVALQQELGDVVLMDAALQFGDLMVHLNTSFSRTIIDLIHEGNLEVDLMSDILIPHNSGLKLLLAPPAPELADDVTPPMIASIIDSLKQQFKAVIIDTHSLLDDITLTVMDSADTLLIITIPELTAIKDTKLFLEVAERLKFKDNRLKVVVNRSTEPGGIKPAKVEEVLSLAHAYHIPQDPRLDAALRKGTPVCLQDASAPSAKAILDMTHHMWQTISEPEMVKEPI